MKTIKQRVLDRVLKQPPTKDGDYAKLAKEFGSTVETVRHYCKEAKIMNVRKNSQANRTKSSLSERLLELIRQPSNSGKSFSKEVLANKLDVSPSKIEEAVKVLAEQNINIELLNGNVELSQTIKEAEPLVINANKFFATSGRTIKFAAIGDTHLCSKYQRLDALNAFYDICVDEGIHKVFLAGNMIDGEARFNKYDILATGVEGQSKYFVENYPQREGVVTEFITGDDHEGWYVQNDQVNIGRYIEDMAIRMGRDDLKYLGHMERDLVLNGAKTSQVIRIIHGGGGSAYATSYTSQKYVESLQAGEKPRLILVGHFHKFEFSYPREVFVAQVGCFEDQTPFMRKKRIQAMVGGTIVTIHQNDDGIIDRCKVEFIPFYSKNFYKNGVRRITPDTSWEYQF